MPGPQPRLHIIISRTVAVEARAQRAPRLPRRPLIGGTDRARTGNPGWSASRSPNLCAPQGPPWEKGLLEGKTPQSQGAPSSSVFHTQTSSGYGLGTMESTMKMGSGNHLAVSQVACSCHLPAQHSPARELPGAPWGGPLLGICTNSHSNSKGAGHGPGPPETQWAGGQAPPSLSQGQGLVQGQRGPSEPLNLPGVSGA